MQWPEAYSDIPFLITSTTYLQGFKPPLEVKDVLKVHALSKFGAAAKLKPSLDEKLDPLLLHIETHFYLMIN